MCGLVADFEGHLGEQHALDAVAGLRQIELLPRTQVRDLQVLGIEHEDVLVDDAGLPFGDDGETAMGAATRVESLEIAGALENPGGAGDIASRCEERLGVGGRDVRDRVALGVLAPGPLRFGTEDLTEAKTLVKLPLAVDQGEFQDLRLAFFQFASQ